MDSKEAYHTKCECQDIFGSRTMVGHRNKETQPFMCELQGDDLVMLQSVSCLSCHPSLKWRLFEQVLIEVSIACNVMPSFFSEPRVTYFGVSMT